MLRGSDFDRPPAPDDIEYAIDLGPVRRGPSGPEVSNAINREVIQRELAQIAQSNLENCRLPSY